MNKKFFQQILNTMMFKKLTAAFSFLRKEKLEEKDLEEMLRIYKKEGYVDAIKESGQDPKEIADMALEAFDASVKKARERFENLLTQTADYMKKKIA